ncbi:MAG: short chain dehydrogenase/reductase family oxidoreductase, partial [Pseudomonadota bacterium]
GVMLHDFSQTPDGVETMFATNLLNHYYLTERLIAAEVLRPDSMVINVSSGGLYLAPLRVESLNTQSADEHHGTRSYTLQKRAQAVLSNHWQSKHRNGPSFYTMHPGWADTQGVQNSLPTFRKLTSFILRNAEQAADTIQWLAATRPKPLKELWFDRKARPLHVYKFTQTSGASESRVAEYLDGFLPSLD